MTINDKYTLAHNIYICRRSALLNVYTFSRRRQEKKTTLINSLSLPLMKREKRFGKYQKPAERHIVNSP